MKTTRILGAAALCAIVVLAGCGKGSESGGSATAGTKATGGSGKSTSSGGWTVVDLSGTLGGDIGQFAYGNNMFFARGQKSSVDKMATSTDGVKWTAAAYGEPGATILNNYRRSGQALSCHGNGIFIKRISGGMAYSSDGAKWAETIVSPSALIPSMETFNKIGLAFGNGRFVATGERVAYSTDGAKWTLVDVSDIFKPVARVAGYGSTAETKIKIIFGNGKFIAWHHNKMAYSTDGAAWTAVANSTFGADIIFTIAYGNNMFVAGGTNGKMATSADGVNWTAVNTGTIFDYLADNGKIGKVAIEDIAFGNGTFVAQCSKGRIAYSKKGR